MRSISVLALVVAVAASSVLSMPAGANTIDPSRQVGGGCSTGCLGPFCSTVVTSVGVGLDGSYVFPQVQRHCVTRAFGLSAPIQPFLGSGPAGNAGDGNAAVMARVGSPYDCAQDGAGNWYCSDPQAGSVRRIGTDGLVTTVLSGLNGGPEGVSIDGTWLYIVAVNASQVVRTTLPCGMTCATPTVFAGSGAWGFTGNEGPATAAALRNPADVYAMNGTVYIADTLNNSVRQVTPDGIIHQFAGTGSAGFSGDGGPATAAMLNQPRSVALAPNGDVYVTDTMNNRLRVIHAGTISTALGTGAAQPTYSGGPTTGAVFSTNPLAQPITQPVGVGVSRDGSMILVSSEKDGVTYVLSLAGPQPTVVSTATAVPTAVSTWTMTATVTATRTPLPPCLPTATTAPTGTPQVGCVSS